jgi:hypothetical protein
VRSSFSARGLAPRHHQVEAVISVVRSLQQSILEPKAPATSPEEPASSRSRNYLIQHSTGSGKSLTIAALTQQLLGLRMPGEGGSRDMLFRRVIIMNDRLVLDAQLSQVAVRFVSLARFLHVPYVNPQVISSYFAHPYGAESASRFVVQCKDTEALAQALRSDRALVILTTIHKFSRYLETDGSSMPGTGTASADSGAWRTALIADEAHRSHGKQRTRYLHNVLTGRSAQSAPLLYISFTSTPTVSALEMFGTPSGDSLRPFHCYSMQQAIDDGVILDPLMNFQSVPIFGRAEPAAADESAPPLETTAFPTAEPGDTLDEEEEEAPAEQLTSSPLHVLNAYDTGQAVRNLVATLSASRELVLQKCQWIVVRCFTLVERMRQTNTARITTRTS